MRIALSRQVFLPKPTGPPVAQFLAAGTSVVDPLPNSKHFLIPVVAGAHRDAESVARLPNRLAIDEHQLIKRRLLRLRRVIDSPPESPIDDEASLAIRIHAAPGSRTRTVASSTLCFPSTEDAWGIGYGGADTVPCKDETLAPASLVGFRHSRLAQDSSTNSETTTLRSRPPILCAETTPHSGALPTVPKILRSE